MTWIEASAGTGKTYTLVQTVLNLVRGGLTADRILLVTFTEKATAELKTRVRAGLRQAWKESGDPNLAQALEDLPALTVATIHGFCRALLGQFPLESGVSFEPEMVDQGRQWRRLLRDELRPQLATLDASLLAWAKLEDEEELLGLARQALDRQLFSLPFTHPTASEQDTFERWRQSLQDRTGPLWEAQQLASEFTLPEDSTQGLGPEVIARHLHASWHKKPYRVLRELLAARTFRDLLPLLAAESLDSLGKWDEGGNIWKKNVADPLPARLERLRAVAVAFVDAAQGWMSALPGGTDLADFLTGCARYRVLGDLCRPVLERRSSRELTFQDLIDRVRRLATSEAGAGLRAAASSRWTAVLIDEFQDTDAEQWDIFSSLFFDAEHNFVLVGDPKQSIYRFRGADLNLYRSVREQVKAAGARSLILSHNFRSTAAMIESVNQIFDPAGGAPWEHPEDFHPSQKGDIPVATLVEQRNSAFVPVPPLASFQPSTQQSWHRHLVHTVLTLLDGRHFLDDGQTRRGVEPGDFLVLVRTKREAWALYRLLTTQGIPATVGGSGGLLRGREAQEILLFLKALESPRSLSAARALAWTRLFAGAPLDLLVPALDEAQADREQGAFLRAFRRVAAALEPGVSDGGGLEALLSQPTGARQVTNAEHVLELVQERHHRGLVPAGQAALSLETWIQSDLQEDEVDLRRDSETRTLRLMTVHAAKGLEAPIVLHGQPSENTKDNALWRVDTGVDFLNTDESRVAEAQNRAAESLRLRYVALTRAQSHQVFQDATATQPVPEISADQWRALGRWQNKSPQTAWVPPLGQAILGLENRRPWVESHSGLWRRSIRGETDTRTVWDRPALKRDDEGPSPDSPVTEPLPAGPAFGDLVHDILEQSDYRGWAPSASVDLQKAAATVVEGHCQRHRSDFGGRDLTRPLGEWLGTALNEPLALGPGHRPVVFTSLEPADTRRELEFHLPLSVKGLESFRWGDRTFQVHRGFLTGRIDLLFRWDDRLYLADWKTNRLAPGQNLDEVMVEAGYDLQAQWYWEALTRLCRLQNESLIPGGVLFVFLRGAGDRPGGIFRGPEELSRVPTLTPLFEETNHA